MRMCVCVCVYVHSCVCDYSCVSEKTFFVVMIRVKKIVNRELYTAHLLPYNSGGTSERAAVRNNAKGKN